MEFLQWRALVARAAGYSMELQTVDGVSFEAPILPLDGLTEENALGWWSKSPDDPLLVMLFHMSHAGVITPADAGPLADVLEQFLQSGRLAEASYVATDSIARHVERMRTEQVISGLRTCVRTQQPAVFSIIEGKED